MTGQVQARLAAARAVLERAGWSPAAAAGGPRTATERAALAEAIGVRRSPLSPEMFRLLERLAGAEGGILRISEIVEARIHAGQPAACAPSSVARTVARLRRRGFLEALGSWDGARFKRTRRVRITDAGRQVVMIHARVAP